MTEHLSEYDSLPHPSQHQNMHYRYAVALNYDTDPGIMQAKAAQAHNFQKDAFCIIKEYLLHAKRATFAG